MMRRSVPELLRYLSAPMVADGSGSPRVLQSIFHVLVHPIDFLRSHLLPGWAERSTILLAMQTLDTHIRLRLGRSLVTLSRRDLVSLPDEGGVPGRIEIGHRVARAFAKRTNGIPLVSINEGLFDVSMTAHLLGGCPMGHDAEAVWSDSTARCTATAACTSWTGPSCRAIPA